MAHDFAVMNTAPATSDTDSILKPGPLQAAETMIISGSGVLGT